MGASLVERADFAEHCVYVCSAEDPQWLEERDRLVSASEVNALFGGRWTTEAQLLERKLSPRKDKVDNRFMWWGRGLERVNMELFGKAAGCEVYPANNLYRHRDYRIGATVDGLVTPPTREALEYVTSSKKAWEGFLGAFRGVKGVGLIEMKNTGTFKAKEWSVRPPLEYWTQVQCQMFVTGLTWAVLVAKIGSDDMRAYLVRYDADWALTMRDRVITFISEWKKLGS